MTTVGIMIRDNLHLIRTGWLDVNGAGPQYAVFDPTKDDPASRYGCPVRAGNPNVTDIRGYLPDNITGGHAPGLQAQAISVVYRLWPDVIPSPHDLEDIDMVNGAATAIVQKALAAGLLDDGGGQPADPCAAVKADLAKANDRAAAADKALATVQAAAAKARKAMPARGGGVYRNILVELLATLEGLL